MFFDVYYLLLVLPAVILALIASARVSSTFKKYASVYAKSGMTGAMAARRVLDAHGLQSVRVERTQGHLSDHYNPKDRTLYLSDAVYGSSSCASIGVAAHEAGHAIQHAEEYTPLRIRSAIIPATNIGSKLAFPLILIGLLFYYYTPELLIIAYVGVALFSLTAIFQLVTLPTEFNASRRALAELESTGILHKEEIPAARRVLSAAAMTYVAALAVSLAQLLRLLLILGSRRRD